MLIRARTRQSRKGRRSRSGDARTVFSGRDGSFGPSFVVEDSNTLERLLESLYLEFGPFEVFERATLAVEEFAGGFVLEMLVVTIFEETFYDVAELSVLL